MKLAMAQTRQDRFHIAGKGCRKGHDLSRPGMTERQCLRMKGLSVNGKTGLLRLIFGISHQGMSQISHMDADLMRPSSLEAAAHDRKAAVTFKDLIIGHGKAAAEGTTAIRMRSLGSRSMRVSIWPRSSLILPRTTAMYVRLASLSLICWESDR